MAALAFDRVSKVCPDGTCAVDGLSLLIGDGEFMVLVGPSGCGKTTALRMLAGLEEVTEGRLWIGDRVVNTLPARDRDIAMVFQSYALYPHLTVYENIAFGLRLRRLPRRGAPDPRSSGRARRQHDLDDAAAREHAGQRSGVLLHPDDRVEPAPRALSADAGGSNTEHTRSTRSAGSMAREYVDAAARQLPGCALRATFVASQRARATYALGSL